MHAPARSLGYTTIDRAVCYACKANDANDNCRICRRPYCSNCFTDHHHEGYGVPLTETW